MQQYLCLEYAKYQNILFFQVFFLNLICFLIYLNRYLRDFLYIEYFYMISDITVLLLSLTYIPVQRIGFSLLTVLISSKLVGIVQRLGGKNES